MIHIGTSGYSYAEWRGSFYPADLPTSRMLAYYAERFSTVEINNTFYRLPSEKILAGWADQTPSGFALTLKAPRRITHEARLRDCEELMARLLRPERKPWAQSSVCYCSSCLRGSRRT